MKKYLLLSVVILATGCATTYQAPQTPEKVISAQHSKSTSELLRSAKQVLLLEGYQIQTYDDQAGIISTTLKNKKLTIAQADCGTTMGIDYLKDNRTKTEVALNIIVNDSAITVKSNIHGEYKPGSATNDITLTCVSKGTIESEVLKKITS
ncbi:hypothetical protein [Pseudoalteromonas byunsanensis]|uniref:Uncharacterized protein n=1 Tax=Pseudoalteromonas byunsanensis TaxID=327939 RepID=A0A1S1N961_9GAMM|nr:hypothetical protein [Pseudoalteromonas byunsanensis]OHU96198.1 hypothetical protein BIW53_06540 [Pseudoalteromonas byunsanensis]